MKNMTVTAARLDKFLRFLNVLLGIAIGVCLVGLAFIAAFFLFHLDPDWVANGYNEVDLGMMSLTIDAAYAPTPSVVLLIAAGSLVLALIGFFFGRKLLNCFRQILNPMKEGLPFQSTVSENLKKSAVYVIAWGIAQNLTKFLETLMIVYQYRLPELFLSDKILKISFGYDVELAFLLVAAVLLLLNYVFRYGESLQQLSDETL